MQNGNTAGSNAYWAHSTFSFLEDNSCVKRGCSETDMKSTLQHASLYNLLYTEVKRVVLHGENCQKAHFMWTPLLTAGLLSWMRTWLQRFNLCFLDWELAAPELSRLQRSNVGTYSQMSLANRALSVVVSAEFLYNYANICRWFGIEVSQAASKPLGAKESSLWSCGDAMVQLTCMLAMATTVFATLWFGSGDVVLAFMIFCVLSCLEWEANTKSTTWFARVPTKANIADHPSRFQKLEILTDERCCNKNANDVLREMLERVKLGKPH